ncbi:MAG: YceI family protein, partial [Bacteroidota bacterium]
FHGSFDKYESLIDMKGSDLNGSTIQFKAESASINTASSMRDEHLREADYFDCKKYPSIEFKSKSVTKNNDNTYSVSGELNFHGVTKPVNLIAIENGVFEHPKTKKTIIGVTIKGTIKRTEFNFAVETSPSILSDEVEIHADLEYSKD